MTLFTLILLLTVCLAYDKSVSDANLAPNWQSQAIRGGSVDLANPRPLYSGAIKTPSVDKKNHPSHFVKYSSEVNINVLSSNITSNGVNPWVAGVNIPGDGVFNTVSYPVGRWGGNRQSSYNWNINSSSGASDWFYITQQQSPTWQALFDSAIQSGMDIMNQIPAMGWVSKQQGKCWSFSVEKYGAQQQTECTASGDATWCSSDAGNSYLTSTGNQVVGNDPTDSMMTSQVSEGGLWATSINQLYGNKGTTFMVGNEPNLWHSTHYDVRSDPLTYDGLVDTAISFASDIKSQCGQNCAIYGYSPWGWCSYWVSALDNVNGGCTTGSDREAHGNLPLAAYYLQQLASYESSNGVRLLDVLDLHFYPQSSNVAFSSDESNTTAYDRLQGTRSLWDWSYIDDSWINGVIAAIPRFQNWINSYYPNTGLSISEYNFGNDDIITSAIAHAEVISIFASFNLTSATRWVKPDTNSIVEDSFKLYLNYDNKNNQVFSNLQQTIAMNTTTSDVITVTSFAFFNQESKIFYITLFNKATSQTHVNVNTGLYNVNQNNNQIYGFDSNNRLGNLGQVTNITANSFSIDMPQYSVRMVVLPQ